MPTSRPFAYNSSGTSNRIAGTLQFGTMTIGGTADSSVYQGSGGLQWWGGPDEDSGYAIIAKPVTSANQPTPVVGPNQIADPTLSGATGGSLPTGWFSTPGGVAGITITYGNVQTSGGINYFDITVSGTRSLGSGDFLITTTPSSPAAVQGQYWGARYWFAVISGTVPGLFIRTTEIGVTSLSTNFFVNPSGNLSLFVGSRLLTQPSTSYAESRFGFTLANGVPVNFTLRVGSPIFGLQQMASVGFNRAATQAEFLQMAALLSSSSPSNEDQAVIALNGSNCWTDHNPATTSGLILSLDPGNNASYPDTGIDWWNLVSAPGGSFKATLSGEGTTYSSSAGGVINFNDTQLGYAQTVSALTATSWSVEVWFRSGKSLAGKETAVVATVADGNGDIAFALGNYDSAQNFLDISSYKSENWVSSGFKITPTVGTWYQLVGTYNGGQLSFYQNGSLLGSNSVGNLPLVTTAVTVGRSKIIDESIDYFNGDISIVRIYNTALSSGDVSKNWNANRARFGL